MGVISSILFYIMLRLINSEIGSSFGLQKLRDLITMKLNDHLTLKIIVYLPAIILTYFAFTTVDSSMILEIITGVLIGLTAAFTYDKTQENDNEK
jgi:hypothetical protein